MDEPIIEQIAAWIEGAIDGQQDPAGTMTLQAVRPTIIDWETNNCKHGDCIIELAGFTKESVTSCSLIERATWIITGFVRELPASTAADTVLARMGETLRRLLMGGNSKGRAAGGIARAIDCPDAVYGTAAGAVVVQMTVEVVYETSLYDGYV